MKGFLSLVSDKFLRLKSFQENEFLMNIKPRKFFVS
jgi:hypothetical protein